VHIGGLVTDELPGIVDLLARKGLWLVEDAAHAHGSLLNDKHAGTFGIAGTFSFYPTKVMTSAEGGMIVTDDDRLADEARLYRDQGKASFGENVHVRMGNNWRLSEPHAIIGLRHFKHLATMIAARRRLGGRAPIAAAGPTSTGSTTCDRAAITAYAVKRPMRTTLSTSEILAFQGSQNESSVARPRKTSPGTLLRSSWTIGSRRTAQAKTATVGQPRPSSNRLDPVIFAAA